MSFRAFFAVSRRRGDSLTPRMPCSVQFASRTYVGTAHLLRATRLRRRSLLEFAAARRAVRAPLRRPAGNFRARRAYMIEAWARSAGCRRRRHAIEHADDLAWGAPRDRGRAVHGRPADVARPGGQSGGARRWGAPARAGRLSKAAAPADGSLEPSRPARGFGFKANWPGFAMVALGAILLLVG